MFVSEMSIVDIIAKKQKQKNHPQSLNLVNMLEMEIPKP